MGEEPSTESTEVCNTDGRQCSPTYSEANKTETRVEWRMRMIWPANSPDLNPIENVWRLLKHRVSMRSPHNVTDLRQYIEEEWAGLRVDDFAKYMNMKERCEAVIGAEGSHTKW
jgi:hypothetical protein